MSRIKMSRFMRIYLTVMAVLAVLLVAGCIVLWNALSAYEKTRPKHVASEVFDTYFMQLDFAGLVHKSAGVSSAAAMFTSDEKINAAVKELYDPSTFRLMSVSSDDTSEKYAVSSENNRIAYFTVSKTDKKASYGMKYYELTDVELFLPTVNSVTVRVPEGYSVKIDGIDVGSGFVTKSGIEGDSAKYMPENVKGITYTEYTVNGILLKPDSITAASPDGKPADIEYNAAEGAYIGSIVYNEALAGEHKDYVLGAARAYAAYMSNDGGFTAIAAYLDKDENIYERVRTAEVYWVRNHSGYKITDETASEFYSYSDSLFSCRVKLKETLFRPGYDDYTENIDVIFYLHKVGEKYLIYEIVTNS